MCQGRGEEKRVKEKSAVIGWKRRYFVLIASCFVSLKAFFSATLDLIIKIGFVRLGRAQ